MDKIPLKERMSFKLARTGVILAFLIGLAFSGLQVYRDFQDEDDKLNESIGAYLASLEPAASRSVHILDENLAQEVINGLLKNQFIQSAKIVDDLGIVLATGRNPAKEITTSWITEKIVPKTRSWTIPLQSSSADISILGKLEVIVNNNWAFDNFFARAFFIFLFGLMRNMVLVVMLMIAFYLTLTRPMADLTEMINKIDPEDPDTSRLQVSACNKNDELGLLAKSTNQFIKLIQDLLAERKKNEIDLILARDELEMRVAERTEELQREITERKHAQKALREANTTLEQRVEDRTKKLKLEIAERRRGAKELVKAKESAELANRTKSEFLANMSHELRTPLNAIIGFSSIMKDEFFGPMKNPRYLEYSADINTSSSHLLQVIGDILDVSKIEIGELVLAESEFDLKELGDGCLRTLEPMARGRKHILYNQIPVDFPRLFADPLRIRQVLLNLITNAVKFTQDGGSITLDARIDSDGRALISLTDTGIGIPKDKLKSVLEPFSQVDNVFTRTHDGVGLGLSLSKSLVRLHNGDIAIESEINIGTSVIISLPADRIRPSKL